MLLVVGLGNPGSKYSGNRHNVGQMVLDALAEGGKFKRHRSGTYCLSLGGILLVKPASYMNLSGSPVQSILQFYSASPADLLVVHDELDIPLGDLRLKQGGGTAGHNGLRSISAHIGSEYARLRVGIGRPPGQQPVDSFVLSDFSGTEKKIMGERIEVAAEAVWQVAGGGLEAGQRFLAAQAD